MCLKKNKKYWEISKPKSKILYKSYIKPIIKWSLVYLKVFHGKFKFQNNIK